MERATVDELVRGTSVAGCFLWFAAATFFVGHLLVGSPYGVIPYIVTATIIAGAALNAVLLRRGNRLGRVPLMALVLVSVVSSAMLVAAFAYMFSG